MTACSGLLLFARCFAIALTVRNLDSDAKINAGLPAKKC